MRNNLCLLEAINLKYFAGVTSEIQCLLILKFICSSFFFPFIVQNVVEGVVHQGGAEPTVVRRVEEVFNGAVPGAQVEEEQEADLEAGRAVADSEVAVVVVVEVDLAVVGDVEVGVSEDHSSAGSYLFRSIIFSRQSQLYGKPKVNLKYSYIFHCYI